jgi:hypothetical protein
VSRVAASALSLMVAGCATDGWTRISGDWPEVRANCRLSGTYIERDVRDRRLLRLTFRHRSNMRLVAEQDGRVACAEHWARERGYRLTTAPAGGDR